jgi:DNA replication licensing factor MCM4
LIGKQEEEKFQILNSIQKILKKIPMLDGKEIGLDEKVKYLHSGSIEEKKFKTLIDQFSFSTEGIICLEDFQKISTDLLNYLEEIMINNRLSVAKAGIFYNLKTNLSILGSLNFDEKLKTNDNRILKNQEIFGRSLSGFHLFYWIKDPFRASFDKKLAFNLVGQLSKNHEKNKIERKISAGIGFNIRVLLFFLKNFSKNDLPFFHKIYFKEEGRWRIINTFLENLNSKKFFTESFRISDFLIKISRSISLIRYSNFVGINDLRYGVIIFLEALKSVKNFPI